MALGKRSMLITAAPFFAATVGSLVALTWEGGGENASGIRLTSPTVVDLGPGWLAGLIAAGIALVAFTIAAIVATRGSSDQDARDIEERDPLLRLAAAALEDDARHQVNPTGRGKL